jgi:hypothetical protein
MPLPKDEDFKLGHYLSFRFFLASFRFIGGDLWQLEDDRGEKPTGKTWIERGWTMVKTW